MITSPAETEFALRRLAAGYASAVDRRDGEAFVALFAPGAVLTVVPEPDSGRSERRITGPDELAKVTVNIARYRRTFHVLGQSTYDIDEKSATGEVYCIAHHLLDDSDYLMYIRYQDRYALQPDGSWLIADRRLLTDWTERIPLGQ